MEMGLFNFNFSPLVKVRASMGLAFDRREHLLAKRADLHGADFRPQTALAFADPKKRPTCLSSFSSVRVFDRRATGKAGEKITAPGGQPAPEARADEPFVRERKHR